MNEHRFHERYRDARPEDLPWYAAEPDPDLVEIFEHDLPTAPATIVDLGAGPAVHSIYLAGRGYQVTALDSVPAARDMALELARARGVTLDYRTVDVLAWSAADPVDAVLDRGFMHTLAPEDRPRWRAVVCEALRPAGLLVLKCFDTRPARDFGPPGLTAADVIGALGPAGDGCLELLALRRSLFEHHDEPHATWTVTARRI